MLRLISPAEMQASEKHYFETSSVPSIDIMEKAARALAGTVLRRFADVQKVFIACGPGGNGGDGYACARLLAEKGIECIIFASAPARSADAVENARRAAQLGIEIRTGELPEDQPDLWIDCLYGTGLSRQPAGFAAELIRHMNLHRAAGAKTIACDIPSGLNGSTGEAHDPCVQADITLTFQLAKHGHFLQDGLDACGEVSIADVSFPADIFPEETVLRMLPSDIRGMLPRRRRNIHKGSCGHLLVIAGSLGMAGAAALCARAALRSGTGLVTVACPESIVPLLQIHAPCAMCIPLPEERGAISAEALPVLAEAFAGKSAVAVGPGLSRRVPPGIIQAVLECGLNTVIDADALNIISENPQLKMLLRPHHILTPHPGEAARLLGRKCTDPVADARELTALGCTAVLKGASRVIADGKRCIISASGGCGMARGGSGDVLTGVLGALLAEKSARTPGESAACACEIHGLAGEYAQAKYGSRAMNSADILEFLPEVFTSHAD